MGAVVVLFLIVILGIGLIASSRRRKGARVRASRLGPDARRGTHRRSHSVAVPAQIPRSPWPSPPGGRPPLQEPGNSVFKTAGGPLPTTQSRSHRPVAGEGFNTPSGRPVWPSAPARPAEPGPHGSSASPRSSHPQPFGSFAPAPAATRDPVAVGGRGRRRVAPIWPACICRRLSHLRRLHLCRAPDAGGDDRQARSSADRSQPASRSSGARLCRREHGLLAVLSQHPGRLAGPRTCIGSRMAGTHLALISGTSSCTSMAWNAACSLTRSCQPAARAEHGALVREVRRLLRIYGMNGSFSGYAGNLLRFLSLGGCSAALPVRAARTAGKHGSCRSSSALASASSRPMPGRCPPRGPLPGSACTRPPGCGRRRTRCPGEFDEIFARRYRERFGDGMMLERGGPLLQAAYRPASPGITSRELPAALASPGRR